MHSALFDLLKSYSALVPIYRLAFPLHLPLNDIHDFLLNSILLNQHLEAYPPVEEYQHSFWKWAIGNLEKLSFKQNNPDFEIDQRIYDRYLEILPPSSVSMGPIKPENRGDFCVRGAPRRQSVSTSFLTHYWPNPNSVGITTDSEIHPEEYQTTTIQESRNIIEGGTTGLRTWPASYILAQFLISHPETVTGRKILELGSGAGLLASVVASLQALTTVCQRGELWLSDGNEGALQQGWDNVQLECNLSSKHQGVKSIVVEWSDALDASKRELLRTKVCEEINPELIIGADLAYDPDLVPSLVSALALIFGPKDFHSPQKRALFAVTLRNPDTYRLFLQTCLNASLVVKDLEWSTGKSMFVAPLESEENEIKLLDIRPM